MSTSVELPQEKLSLGRLIKAYKWVFSTYFSFAPAQMILLIISQVLEESKGLIYAFTLATILDKLIHSAATPSARFVEIIPYLFFLLAYYVFDYLVNIVSRYARRYIKRLSVSKLNIIFYRRLNQLGIASLEDPITQNRIQRCQQWMGSSFDFLTEGFFIFAYIVKAIVAALSVIVFMPILIPVVIVLAIVKSIPEAHYNRKDYFWMVNNTNNVRKADELVRELTTPSRLQEISVTGAYSYLSKRYEDFFDWYNAGTLRLLAQRYVAFFSLGTVDSILGVVAYGVVFFNFFKGLISVGTITYQMKAIDSYQNAISSILSSYTFISDTGLRMEDFVILFEKDPPHEDGKITLPKLNKGPEIEFKNVSFKYPRADKYIFKDLNLKINAGEEIAIVGHNGAGKTTLVKLLARFYQVTSGEILINGVNLNDLKLDDWYKNLGVLFQDYNFYTPLTAEENIYIGDYSKSVDKEKMIKSAKNADAHDFIMEYKNQYEQVMGEKFEGGIRPSSGQQQKIAIARFFYRNVPLIIFDEPTAAIDAVAEYKIFNRIYKFFTDKTVVIISHRFSTVRNADRIIVMEKGKIVEQGTHTELLKKEGTYAHAYKLQAEGYKD